jgi:xanthine/uracil/vitamin C permease (AzgA family)
MLEKLFKLKEHGTTAKIEIIAGKFKDVTVIGYIVAVLFVLKYIFL